MPTDVRLFTSKIIRTESLPDYATMRSSLAVSNLVAISGGHDFLLQASNRMCVETAFKSLRLPWMTGQLDAQTIAALRATGATFKSPLLQQTVTAQVGGAPVIEVLLLFSERDVMFDSPNECRVRLNMRIALGSSFHMPKEPGLSRRLTPGEAVQQRFSPVRNPESDIRVWPALLAGEMPSFQPPVLRTFGGSAPDVFARADAEIYRKISIHELDRHIDLGDRSSFEVAAWVGSGVLEIPAVYGAAAQPIPKTITVAADVHAASVKFTELSEDAAILLSASDPTGLAQSITYSVRRRGSVPLLDDISLLGAPSTAKAGHLGPLEAGVFPTRLGASSLNVGATIVAGRVAARSSVDFIESARYGVIWSADAVRLLVRYCWETGVFPRGVVQAQDLRVTVNGVERNGQAISVFQFEELTNIELEVDSNGDRDVLYTNGSARVVPKFIRLENGDELHPKDPNDPHFKPSKNMRWSAFGELTQGAIVASTPELFTWMRAMTNGVTSRLGRPFTNAPDGAVVFDSRITVPQQRVALLVK